MLALEGAPIGSSEDFFGSLFAEKFGLFLLHGSTSFLVE
jgi:hypothetical protein